MASTDPYTPEPPFTYECPSCGHRLTAEKQPDRCPVCGERMQNISIPRQQ